VAEGARKGSPGALLNRLFGVRTWGLSGQMEPADLADYLSGLLIGAEIADAASTSGETVHIIASEALAERYQRALGQRRIKPVLFSPHVVAAGHMQIARAAGLISAKD
jgi:2-dehydro-3-deoxygalactonokinase